MRSTRHAGYFRNTEQAQRTARAQLEFVFDNLHHLRKQDRTSRMEDAALSFAIAIGRGQQLLPNQLNYVDGIYEATMKGLGMPSVNLHADQKRRGLNYGRR